MRHLRRCRRTRGIRVLSGVCPVVVRVTKCYPCGQLQSRCAMEYDQDKVDEMVLELLCLTMFEEDQDGARAWKGYDWVAMDRLHAKGYVSDPKSKAKSVVVTVKGRDPASCSRNTSARKNRTRFSGRLRVKDPSCRRKRVRARITARQAPVPQRARDALRLRCAPERRQAAPTPGKPFRPRSEWLSLPLRGRPFQGGDPSPARNFSSIRAA